MIMYQEQELNPRRKRWKSPVYLMVVLAFLACILPIRKIIHLAIEDIQSWSENRIVELSEAQAVWQLREEVYKRALSKGKDYGPEEFCEDKAVLITVRNQINGRISASNEGGIPTDISGFINETLRDLHARANLNFPRRGKPGAENLTIEEQARNTWRWREADMNAPLPEGFESIVSFIDWRAFGKWLLMTYVRFLPFAFILILFNLWLKGSWEAMWQEPFLRAKYFLPAVLAGPIGVAIYSEFDPALQWRFAKLRADFCQQAGSWRLGAPEEKALWLQAEQPILNFQEALARAKEMPELVVRQSRLAMVISCLTVVVSAPFLAFSAFSAFGQSKEQEQVTVLSEQEDEGAEWVIRSARKLDHQTVFAWMAVVVHYSFPTRPENREEAKVEFEEIPNCWVSHAWFLPPSLAPPAKFKEVITMARSIAIIAIIISLFASIVSAEVEISGFVTMYVESPDTAGINPVFIRLNIKTGRPALGDTIRICVSPQFRTSGNFGLNGFEIAWNAPKSWPIVTSVSLGQLFYGQELAPPPFLRNRPGPVCIISPANQRGIMVKGNIWDVSLVLGAYNGTGCNVDNNGNLDGLFSVSYQPLSSIKTVVAIWGGKQPEGERRAGVVGCEYSNRRFHARAETSWERVGKKGDPWTGGTYALLRSQGKIQPVIACERKTDGSEHDDSFTVGINLLPNPAVKLLVDCVISTDNRPVKRAAVITRF